LTAGIIADLVKDIADKEALAGAASINDFIRASYLQFIDRKWLDHLENMESLREAVYLRGYAQKNPLTEYKIEGFQIFDTMIDQIRQEIASRVHLVRIQTAPPQTRQDRAVAVSMQASHAASQAWASASQADRAQGRAAASSAGQSGVTVVRSVPKVGRNEPCPCGSGKKYKHCHGM
jgi:preprotein translocase subunit SecA